MSETGDKMMKAQRKQREKRKDQKADKCCPFCLRLESKGHGPICPMREK